MRLLDAESQKLKQLVADLCLDKQMLKDVLAKIPEPAATENDRC
ncbi:hypothetical protein EP7_001898 [Isosphaeraceae bacterium EP7]